MRYLLIGTTTVSAVLAKALPLQAQIPSRPGPPPDPDSALPYALALLLVVVVGVAAFRSSKRGHQD